MSKENMNVLMNICTDSWKYWKFYYYGKMLRFLKGEWNDDIEIYRNDLTCYTTSKNDVYKGQLINGIPHGSGILKSNRGPYYKGQWDKGFFQSGLVKLKNNLFVNTIKYTSEIDI